MSTEQHIHANSLINLTYIKGIEHRLSIKIPNHNLVNSVISTWFSTLRRVIDMMWIRALEWKPVGRIKPSGG